VDKNIGFEAEPKGKKDFLGCECLFGCVASGWRGVHEDIRRTAFIFSYVDIYIR